jgi:xylono-1,5-lactonase
MRYGAARQPMHYRRKSWNDALSGASKLNISPHPVWLVEAQLGEGPAWFQEDRSLSFVDIKRGLLHRYIPHSDARESQVLGGRPSFVVPAADGGLLIGSGHDLYRADASGLGVRVTTLDMPTRNRMNDATVDGSGRLWFGTMDDGETRATGALWCLDRGRLFLLGEEAVVTNGPAVAADGSLLYHVDTGERAIWRFTIGADGSGNPCLTNKEPFLQLGEKDGHPDGVVLDAEDCLWVALWDGWGVRRYAPDGTLLCTIAFPCARVTKLAFGGPDLRTAYVTTARTGLDSVAMAAQPLAGALFAFDSPVSGLPLPAVRLS